jgi:hypothetical protein
MHNSQDLDFPSEATLFMEMCERLQDDSETVIKQWLEYVSTAHTRRASVKSLGVKTTIAMWLLSAMSFYAGALDLGVAVMIVSVLVQPICHIVAVRISRIKSVYEFYCDVIKYRDACNRQQQPMGTELVCRR